MSLTQEQISRLMKLSWLDSASIDEGRISSNLNGIISYVDVLSQAPTDKMNPSLDIWLSLRDDVVVKFSESWEECLGCTHQKVIAHQISIQNIMHTEG